MEIVTYIKPVTVPLNEYREDLKTLVEASNKHEGPKDELPAGKFTFPTAERATHVRKIQQAANESDKTARIVDEAEDTKTGNTAIVIVLTKKHKGRKGGTVDTGADVVTDDTVDAEAEAE